MTAGIILAGGENTRYGTNKALIDLGGQPLIKLISDKLFQLFPKVYVVTNTPEEYSFLDKVEFVPDLLPEKKGILEALYSGLKQSSEDENFFFACDMPYLNLELIQKMLEIKNNFDVVIPVIKRKPTPFHTIFKKSCLPSMERTLEKGSKKLAMVFRDLNVKYVPEEFLKEYDENLNSFFHIITFVDYLVASKDF